MISDAENKLFTVSDIDIYILIGCQDDHDHADQNKKQIGEHDLPKSFPDSLPDTQIFQISGKNTGSKEKQRDMIEKHEIVQPARFFPQMPAKDRRNP